MHGQAVRSGWLDDEDGARVIQLLMQHAESDNPRVAIPAIDELVKIRALDIKSQELALKERIADDKRRIAVLARLAALDPGELARRAQSLGIAVGGRKGFASGTDGSEASEAAGLKDSDPA
jgi:hypothetical protein